MSDVVKALSDVDEEMVGGLVTPSSSMLMPWLAGIVSPVLRKQVRVVVLLPKQDPTVALVVVSVTVDLTIVLRLVLVGKLTTIWLLAVFDRVPVPDVVKPIV